MTGGDNNKNIIFVEPPQGKHTQAFPFLYKEKGICPLKPPHGLQRAEICVTSEIPGLILLLNH
eukprot:13030189-Ditylum_brightwellii.AAC.1